MSREAGGAAFPAPDTYHPNGQVEYGELGMSLRDYFAAKAMAGFIVGTEDPDEDFIARTCYKVADAMLKARDL